MIKMDFKREFERKGQSSFQGVSRRQGVWKGPGINYFGSSIQ